MRLFFGPKITYRYQPSIKSTMCSKLMIGKTKMSTINQQYDANLHFNITQSKFYQVAIDDMITNGPGFNGSSLHGLRKNLLKNVMNEV